MSDGIWYKGKMLGSVHYFVYIEGKLLGRRGDLYLRLNDPCSLETLFQLSPQSRLRVGGDDKSHEMTYRRFREEILAKTRDIHIEKNSVGTSVHGV